MTVLATLALLASAQQTEAGSNRARDNGMKWLAEHNGEDPKRSPCG